MRPLTLDPGFQTCQGGAIFCGTSERSCVAAWVYTFWMVSFTNQTLRAVHLVGYQLGWEASIGGW